jgi:hypothetical protein
MATDLSTRARLLVEEILHPEESNQFVSGCVPTSAEELVKLRQAVADHLAFVSEAATRAASVDLETATAIADALAVVLADPASLGVEERALLRGAAEYFIRRDDGADDLADAIGFDDDARVLNRVLDALGRSELTVSLD